MTDLNLHPGYTTQIGPDGSGHERCGPAVVASVLLSAGWESDPYQLVLEVANRVPGGWYDQGTTVETMLRLANEYGFKAQTWVVWTQAVEALQAGKAVLVLNMNEHLFPTNYPFAPGWRTEHWIRLVDLEDDELAYVYDPLTYLPQSDGRVYQGPTIQTIESIREAIRATPDAVSGIVMWRDE